MREGEPVALIELRPGSVAAAGGRGRAGVATELGSRYLEGEIVGSKCRLAGLIARPVGVRGRVIRRVGATILQVDPAAIERLPAAAEGRP